MRKLMVATVVAVLMGLALPALAHNFGGSGDCDGWSLQLDGEWGAVDILVDGVSVGLDQSVNVPDASDAESRAFTIVWDKTPAGPSRSDVTVTHTLTRDLSGCNVTTTTTVPEEPSTTLPEETTTTVADTTTTLGNRWVCEGGQVYEVTPDHHLYGVGFDTRERAQARCDQDHPTTTTTTSVSSTVVEEPTTVPSTTTDPADPVDPAEELPELPFTGFEHLLLSGAGLALISTGGLLVRRGRS